MAEKLFIITAEEIIRTDRLNSLFIEGAGDCCGKAIRWQRGIIDSYGFLSLEKEAGNEFWVLKVSSLGRGPVHDARIQKDTFRLSLNLIAIPDCTLLTQQRQFPAIAQACKEASIEFIYAEYNGTLATG